VYAPAKSRRFHVSLRSLLRPYLYPQPHPPQPVPLRSIITGFIPLPCHTRPYPITCCHSVSAGYSAPPPPRPQQVIPCRATPAPPSPRATYIRLPLLPAAPNHSCPNPPLIPLQINPLPCFLPFLVDSSPLPSVRANFAHTQRHPHASAAAIAKCKYCTLLPQLKLVHLLHRLPR